MPPDSRFISLVTEASLEVLQTVKNYQVLVIDMGQVNEAELAVLENQKMRGVPVWWEKPIFVAFITWVPEAMIVLPEGTLVSYAGELVVMVKTSLGAKEFNRLVHFGKVSNL